MSLLIHFQCKGRRKISGPTFSVTSKLRLAVLLAAAVVMLQGVDAQAVPFTSDVTITGDITYDTGFALADNTTTFGGIFSTTEGGTTTTSTFDETGVITGVNPLLGTLTDIGDSFAMTAGASGDPDSVFAIGMDLSLDITNTSTLPYLVTFGLVFDHSVDSSGDDAYVESQFTLDDDSGEIFFTHLWTDTVNGNEVGGESVAGFGGPLSESGTDSFTISLDPLGTWFFDGDLTMEGGAFACDFDGSFSAALTVTDVTVVPVPGAVLLGSIGLSFAGCLLRRFKDRS